MTFFIFKYDGKQGKNSIKLIQDYLLSNFRKRSAVGKLKLNGKHRANFYQKTRRVSEMSTRQCGS